jgi:hypothetical protein
VTKNTFTMVVACAAVLLGAIACSTTNTGPGGSVYKLPDAGKSNIDATTGEQTGTGTGDDKTCGGACPAVGNADATCTAGTCGYSCHTGYLDCDGNPKNGCEIDGTTHPSHCGSCDKVCGDVPNGTPTCVAAACAAACDPGWQVCKSDPLVCDTNTDSDETHCGDCGTECPGGPQATPRCVNAACELKCDPGFADCDKNPDNGCEINITNDPLHCGSCGLACETNTCVNSACECASSSQSATLIPLDIFIMMDQSGSMKDSTGTGVSKWAAVSTALTTFVNDPASAGIGVGIQYFPLVSGGTGTPCPSACDTSAQKTQCKAAGGTCSSFLFLTSCDNCGGSGGTSCAAGDYSKADVGISVLPGNGVNITNSIAKHSPSGGTPTGTALEGAIAYAQSWAKKNPTHTVVVALATDGEPTECSVQNIPGIAGIAANGVNGSPKVLTFVIGVGSSLGSLNGIAAGGGTGSAFVVDTGGNVVQQFGAALKAIQGKALGCAYTIPAPSNGQPIDYSKVNVQLTLNGTAQVLPYVTNEAKCDPSKGGWHYDDPVTPSQILLCGTTCKAVQADANAKVDIQLGCPRVGNP